MPDFLKIMQQVQQMQDRLKVMQDELEKVTVIGSAGGGMVTVVADGKGNVRKVRIDPAAVNPADVEMLEDLVTAAISEAQKRAADAAKDEMGKITGGLNLPFPLPL